MALKDKIQRLEQERKLEELYQLEKQLTRETDTKIVRSRYLEQKFDQIELELQQKQNLSYNKIVVEIDH